MSVAVRRAEIEDIKDVEALVASASQLCQRRFGSFSVGNLVHAAVLAVSIVDDDEGLVGFVAFTDTPPDIYNLQEDWPEYTSKYLPSHGIHPSNTVWLKLLVAEKGREEDVVEGAFSALFSTLGHVDRVLGLSPDGHSMYEPVQQLFDPTSDTSADSVGPIQLFSCARASVVPELSVRAAQVEDHDDLVPIFDQQSKVLTQVYGEFFLAKLIESQDDSNKALVAESNGRAVGFVSLTSEMDPIVLQQCFDLEPYDSLFPSDSDNAFCITLFCVDEPMEARSWKVIAEAFALYPDRDYCLLTLPHISAEFPLLKNFVFVRPKPTNTLAHVLYLAHRDSIRSAISVRYMRPDDTQAVSKLLSWVDNQDDILSGVKVCMDAVDKEHHMQTMPHGFYCVVVECQSEIVGMLLMQSLAPFPHELRVLHDNFLLSPHVSLKHQSPHQHALLIFSVINPLFRQHTRFVLQDTMRISGHSVVYYQVGSHQPVQDVLEDMVQVAPRAISDCKPLGSANKHEQKSDRASTAPFATASADSALFVLTRRLLDEPKDRVNSRIVLVGASDTALACLETLLTQPHLDFTSITLVSKTGFPTGFALGDKGGQPQWRPWKGNYDQQQLARLAMNARVHVIEGTVVDINCADQLVVMEDDSVVPYEYLLLTPGLQDSLAKIRLHAITEHSAADPTTGGGDKKADTDDDITERFQLQGLYSALEPTHGPEAMQFLAHRANDRPVIVYGSTLTALCTVQKLLFESVPASNIVWVSDKAPSDTSWCCGDRMVQQRMETELRDAGVHVLPQLELVAVEHYRGFISSAIFTDLSSSDAANPRASQAAGAPQLHLGPYPGSVRIDCNMLLSASAGDVDFHILRAVTENSLVYDGGIVVDNHFRTARERVYAAGPAAKFSRRFTAGSSSSGATMARFNSSEVGTQLAEQLLEELEKDDEKDEQDEKQADSTLPDLGHDPVVCYGDVPGYTFFNCHKPSFEMQKTDSIIMTDFKNCLCRLVFDELSTLKAVTILSQSPVPVHDMPKLLGLPSSYLNQLITRYDKMEVDDIVGFLQQPWAFPLYQDTFPELKSAVKDVLSSPQYAGSVDALIDTAIEQLNAGKDVQDLLDLFAQVPDVLTKSVEAAVKQRLPTSQ